MATTNPVYQVLVTSGNQAILAAGSRVSALLNGQLGIFNYHTGLSVDGSVPADCKDIVIMVGINRTTGGTDAMEDFNKSAGQLIQTRNAKSLTVKAYVAEISKVVEITDFTTYCNTDYLVKLDFKAIKNYLTNGYNQLTKTFNFTTGCCAASDDCDDCPQAGDGVELVAGLIANINADPDALVTASAFGWKIVATINTAPTADGNTTVTVGSTTYTVAVLDADTTAQAATKIVAAINTQTDSPYRASVTGSAISIYAVSTSTANTATFAVSGSGVTANAITGATKTTITDTDAFSAAFSGVNPGIRITANTETRPHANSNINVTYHKTGLLFDVYLVEGLDACNGTVTTITEAGLPEGKGYDLKQLEYVAGGWNGKPGPYRQNAITGLEKDGFEYFASVTANYTQISLTYDQMSVGGWLEYLNNLETIIAIPCADSTTLQGLIAITDLIFTQFQAKTNDVAGIDCTNAATSTLGATTDGISSLS